MICGTEPENGGRPGQHVVKRYPQGIDIRRISMSRSSSCSGLAKCGVPTKPPAWVSVPGVFAFGLCALGQPEVDDFNDAFAVLVDQHQVRGFKSRWTRCCRAAAARARVTCRQIFQRFDRIERTFFTLSIYEATVLPVDELHRIEIAIGYPSRDGRPKADVLMAQSGRCSGFP